MVLLDSVGPNIDHIPTPHKKKKNFTLGVIKDVLSVIFFSFCVFLFINFPAITLIGTYKFYPHKVEYKFSTQDVATVVRPNVAQAPTINQYADNSIFIPKIGVKAPIGWDVKNADIMDQLEKNVVHLDGTSKPGGPGDVFLTGHSSNYWWKHGDYNTVFALLPQLNEGDEIIVTYQGEFHYYKITGKQEVKKDEVSSYVDSDTPKLTLMTCVPVGTNLRRLLVFASPR